MNNTDKITALILAGGKGTRLYPLTETTPKPLLPVGGKPMIVYVLEKLAKAGIKEVILLIKEEQLAIYTETLRAPSEYGLNKIDYVFDAPGVEGLLPAIVQAKDLVGERFVVTCGDVLFDQELSTSVSSFDSQNDGAQVVGLYTKDSAGFGLLKLKDDKVVEYMPKDKDRHEEGFIESGTYFFHSDVFEKIANITKTLPEAGIRDLLDLYIREQKLTVSKITSWWSDVGNSLEEYHSVDRRFTSRK